MIQPTIIILLLMLIVGSSYTLFKYIFNDKCKNSFKVIATLITDKTKSINKELNDVKDASINVNNDLKKVVGSTKQVINLSESTIEKTRKLIDEINQAKKEAEKKKKKSK